MSILVRVINRLQRAEVAFCGISHPTKKIPISWEKNPMRFSQKVWDKIPKNPIGLKNFGISGNPKTIPKMKNVQKSKKN